MEFTLAAACTPQAGDDSASRNLLQRGAHDQAIRHTFAAALRRSGRPDSALSLRMVALDSANTERLRSAIAVRGWPRTSDAGPDAARAAFLLVQHAADDVFQREVLEVTELPARRGEVGGEEFALLSDRVAVHVGRRQVHGTQAAIRDGRVVLDPIADSAGVDARRPRLGLSPLAECVRMLDSVFALQPDP